MCNNIVEVRVEYLMNAVERRNKKIIQFYVLREVNEDRINKGRR